VGAGEFFKPLAECFLAGDEGEGVCFLILARERRGAVEDVFFPGLNALDLLFIEAKVDELEAVGAVGAERAGEAGGGALRGRSWVVEFVGEIAGKFAESCQLFSLLLDAGYFSY